MQIERHVLPDGAESVVKRVFEAEDRRQLHDQMAQAAVRAHKTDTLQELKQVEFDPETLCPCGSKRKAKNCCAGRLLARLAKERAAAKDKLQPLEDNR